jgi:hypothetical protein
MCTHHLCRQTAFVKRDELYLCVFCYKELRAEEEHTTIKELEAKWQKDFEAQNANVQKEARGNRSGAAALEHMERDV